jgi:hypothetical protein
MMYTLIDGEPVQLGIAYGYCFLPLAEGGRELMSFSPAGDNEAWEPHPFLEAQGEAEKWLRDRGLAGEVLRYAHHEALEDRNDSYRPWVTAGVVAKIEGEPLQNKSPKYAEALEWSKRLSDDN